MEGNPGTLVTLNSSVAFVLMPSMQRHRYAAEGIAFVPVESEGCKGRNERGAAFDECAGMTDTLTHWLTYFQR